MDGARPPMHAVPGPWKRGFLSWLAGWWRLLDFGSQMLVLALSPSTRP